MAKLTGTKPAATSSASSSASSQAVPKITINAMQDSSASSVSATPPSSIEAEEDTVRLAAPKTSMGKQIRRRPVQSRPIVKAVKATARETRNFSGDTLVDDIREESATAVSKAKVNAAATASPHEEAIESGVDSEGPVDHVLDHALDMSWEVGGLADSDPSDLVPSSSRPKHTSGTLETISEAAGKLKSALGKRSRDAVETSMEVLGLAKKRQSGRIRAIESATPDPADNMSDDGMQDQPAKRPRPLSDALSNCAGTFTLYGSKRKRYENAGLYAGQTDPAVSSSKYRPSLPLPMYGMLDRDIDFRIPYDIYGPQKQKDAPKEWRKLASNRFVDDAKELWRRQKLAPSACGCKAPRNSTDGCDDRCLNRTMLYECDANNCSLTPDQCTNRAFAELAGRMKKGGPYQHGIEIFKTKDCGFGVRASRSFAPGQIIVEYCGEVITPEECDRRMNQEYKDKDCYYLMDFDQGMIIDATRGNIARFVNHACEPNCRMEKRIVKHEPKMALFAGPNGIMTGEELTYDYNFDNFSSLNVLDCRCGSEHCRGKLDRRDAKREKETLAASLKRKAAELLSSKDNETAGRPVVLKKRKTARWSKGWAYVDPKMEALRLQEDSIEKGTTISITRVEPLHQAGSSVADSNCSSRPTSGPSLDKTDFTFTVNDFDATGTCGPQPGSAAGGASMSTNHPTRRKGVLERAAEKLGRAGSTRGKRAQLARALSQSTTNSRSTSVNDNDARDDTGLPATFRLPELDFTTTTTIGTGTGTGTVIGTDASSRTKTNGQTKMGHAGLTIAPSRSSQSAPAPSIKSSDRGSIHEDEARASQQCDARDTDRMLQSTVRGLSSARPQQDENMDQDAVKSGSVVGTEKGAGIKQSLSDVGRKVLGLGSGGVGGGGRRRSTRVKL